MANDEDQALELAGAVLKAGEARRDYSLVSACWASTTPELA